MKNILVTLFAAIAMLSSGGVNASDKLPCDKLIFRALCNPDFKLVEHCYDCENLVGKKDKCFPSFNKFDITDLLSSKKWNCTVHEFEDAKGQE